jgi:hypothetical protein
MKSFPCLSGTNEKETVPIAARAYVGEYRTLFLEMGTLFLETASFPIGFLEESAQ